jgi:hypothetical protein
MKHTIKNAFKLKAICRIAGIIALAALIGFSMVACEDGVGGPGGGYSPGGTGGTGGNNPSGVAGRLTIPGLPIGSSLEEWWVRVYPQGTALSDTTQTNCEALCFDISRNGTNFPLRPRQQVGETWTGSGSRLVVLYLDIIGNTNRTTYWATVNFSNGSATVPFSSFTRIY